MTIRMLDYDKSYDGENGLKHRDTEDFGSDKR